MKLSWFNKSVGIYKLYLAYENVQYKIMQDIREIELRDSESNANNKICFELRATSLRPHLHTEEFQLCPHKIFHKGTSTEEFTTLHLEYTTLLSNTITSTQEG